MEASSTSPRWLANWDRSAAASVHHAGSGLILVVVFAQLAVGLTALKRGWPRLVAGWAGLGIGLAQWVLGQGMGQLYSGQATDPNTGVPVLILAVALLATNRLPRAASKLHTVPREGDVQPLAVREPIGPGSCYGLNRAGRSADEVPRSPTPDERPPLRPSPGRRTGMAGETQRAFPSHRTLVRASLAFTGGR
ncbi:MAG: hypothetical protein M0Z87_06315 [Actinomycetota bacterium]|nr:hypothetical protein [Actinomycetota bacterium]